MIKVSEDQDHTGHLEKGGATDEGYKRKCRDEYRQRGQQKPGIGTDDVRKTAERKRQNIQPEELWTEPQTVRQKGRHN